MPEDGAGGVAADHDELVGGAADGELGRVGQHNPRGVVLGARSVSIVAVVGYVLHDCEVAVARGLEIWILYRRWNRSGMARFRCS